MKLKGVYDTMPPSIQNLICSVQGSVLKRQRYNRTFWDHLEQLNTSQWKDECQITSFKENEIERLLNTCYKYVPYYATSFKLAGVLPKDFKGLEDIQKFPILEKEDIRKDWKQIVNFNYPKKRLVHSHTSGSTGKALDFYLTKDSIPFQWAIWWRFRERYGFHLGDKHLNFTGKLVVPIQQEKPPFWRINYPLNQWLVNMQHINSRKVPHIVDMINREEFQFFSGYPSIISAFCSFVKELNLKIFRPPKIVFTGAEKIFGYQKQLIQEILCCTVTDHYGFSEGAGNASKCIYDFYHEDYEFGHLECFNPQINTDGGYFGEILTTGFSNYGMPFLRYRVGDTATWSNRNCLCGIQSSIISGIEGRSEEFVITPEGTRILRFDYLFKDTRSIKECQIVQKEIDSLLFRIVKRNTYKKETEEQLIRLVKKWISPTITVHFEYIEEIKRSESGKFRAVISELR
jgi:phenylacetate-CoA ligase